MGADRSFLNARYMARAKLTKKRLFSLDAGWYVVSNGYESARAGTSEAAFHEAVAPLSHREEQWQRLKARGQNGKLFHIYDRKPGRSSYTVIPSEANGPKWQVYGLIVWFRSADREVGIYAGQRLLEHPDLAAYGPADTLWLKHQDKVRLEHFVEVVAREVGLDDWRGLMDEVLRAPRGELV